MFVWFRTWQAVAPVAGLGRLPAGASIQTGRRGAGDVGGLAVDAREARGTGTPAAGTQSSFAGLKPVGIIQSRLKAPPKTTFQARDESKG